MYDCVWREEEACWLSGGCVWCVEEEACGLSGGGGGGMWTEWWRRRHVG